MHIEANILAEDLIAENQFYYTAGDYRQKLQEGFLVGKTPGETSYLKWLDDMFTLRPGFLYCFTGWPGSGKSEFLTQLTVLQAIYKKRKICFYSPESYPVDEFIDTIIHCSLGSPVAFIKKAFHPAFLYRESNYLQIVRALVTLGAG